MNELKPLDLSKNNSRTVSVYHDETNDNVQPHKSKNILQLGTPLNRGISFEVQKKLNEEIEYFESLISTYDGDDPLKPRYEFACWVEQNYSNLGPRINYVGLLENIIRLFKDDLLYKQDQRFIQILIKYVELQQNPVELYQLMFVQGLGSMCAIFYTSWANALDKINDFKHANMVYETGIRYSAQPMEQLKEAQVKFQLTLGKRMLGCQVSPKIQDSSNQLVVPKIPTSNSFGTNIHGVSDKKICKSTIKIYQDENDVNVENTKQKSVNISSAADINKENISRKSWKSKTPISKNIITGILVKSNVSNFQAKPMFYVHEDCEQQIQNVTSVNTSILKPLKSDFSYKRSCPLALFEPPDPTKRYRYPKQRIYSGGRELQLEELYAAVYIKKYEEERQQCVELIPVRTNEHFTIHSDDNSSQSITSLGKEYSSCQSSSVIKSLNSEETSSLEVNSTKYTNTGKEMSFFDKNEDSENCSTQNQCSSSKIIIYCDENDAKTDNVNNSQNLISDYMSNSSSERNTKEEVNLNLVNTLSNEKETSEISGNVIEVHEAGNTNKDVSKVVMEDVESTFNHISEFQSNFCDEYKVTNAGATNFYSENMDTFTSSHVHTPFQLSHVESKFTQQENKNKPTAVLSNVFMNDNQARNYSRESIYDKVDGVLLNNDIPAEESTKDSNVLSSDIFGKLSVMVDRPVATDTFKIKSIIQDIWDSPVAAQNPKDGSIQETQNEMYSNESFISRNEDVNKQPSPNKSLCNDEAVLTSNKLFTNNIFEEIPDYGVDDKDDFHLGDDISNKNVCNSEIVKSCESETNSDKLKPENTFKIKNIIQNIWEDSDSE